MNYEIMPVLERTIGEDRTLNSEWRNLIAAIIRQAAEDLRADTDFEANTYDQRSKLARKRYYKHTAKEFFQGTWFEALAVAIDCDVQAIRRKLAEEGLIEWQETEALNPSGKHTATRRNGGSSSIMRFGGTGWGSRLTPVRPGLGRPYRGRRRGI